METAKVWIAGEWRAADAASTFEAENPSTGKKLRRLFPVSRLSDCDRALSAAAEAAHAMEQVPPEKIAAFLEAYAERIAASAETLAQAAHEETGLALTPRLQDVEIPRTVDQLRQAAAAIAIRSTLQWPTSRSCDGQIGTSNTATPTAMAFPSTTMATTQGGITPP